MRRRSSFKSVPPQAGTNVKTTDSNTAAFGGAYIKRQPSIYVPGCFVIDIIRRRTNIRFMERMFAINSQFAIDIANFVSIIYLGTFLRGDRIVFIPRVRVLPIDPEDNAGLKRSGWKSLHAK